MNKLSPFSALLLIILFFIANTFAQSKFEGKIQIKYDAGDTKGNMIYMVKGEKIRLDFKTDNKDEEMSMIMDPATKKTLMLMPSQKMFMEYPFNAMSEETNEKMDESFGKIKMTGETKEINGYNCQKILVTNEDNTAEIWATKDLGNFMNFFNNQMGESKNPEWLPEFMREGFFPMLGVQKDESGEEEYRWEVTKIEKQSLSSDLFAPPADFKKMDIPGMK